MVTTNTTERRSLLSTGANPDSRVDYVARLGGHADIADGTGRLEVDLRYVPDKAILAPEALGRYLGALGAGTWSSVEEIATAVLDDINNEVVPRWVRVTVVRGDKVHPAIDHHSVTLEDRQPKWDNPAIVARARRD